MSRLSKQERRQLVEQEAARRHRAREDSSPLTRDELDELHAFVARKVFHEGHDQSFSITREWLRGRDDADAVLSFLQSQRVMSDWDVLVDADPHQLFGPTPSRLARMPLEAEQLRELLAHLEDALPRMGCEHDHRLTRTWLEENELPVETVEFALIAQGGGCDCEVVLNVDPERIYPA